MHRWQAYQALVAVIECGSYTAAADRLGMSKSAVSRLVSSLEDRLGSQLMFRTTRQVAPTNLGRSIYSRCVEAFSELERIEQDAMGHDAVPRGRLRVAAADVVFGDRWVAPLVADLAKEYSQLEIELLVTDRMVDIVGEGYDIAIRYNSLLDSSLRAQKVCELPHVCAASPGYLRRAGTPATPEDLVRHSCLVASFEPCKRWNFRGMARGKPPPPNGHVLSNSGPALIAAALAGIGIVWLPELYMREDIQAGGLVEVLSAYRGKPMPVWAVYPTRRQTTAKVQIFVRRLQKLMTKVGAEAPREQRAELTVS